MRTASKVRRKSARSSRRRTSFFPGKEGPMQEASDPFFGKTRIHADAEASQVNERWGSDAMTVGNDIFFRQNQYGPQETRGQHLLAHELTHVTQQSRIGMRIQQKRRRRKKSAPKGVEKLKSLSDLVLYTQKAIIENALALNPDPEQKQAYLTQLAEYKQELAFRASAQIQAYRSLVYALIGLPHLATAVYDTEEPEILRQAVEWAKREKAFGYGKRSWKPKNLRLMQATGINNSQNPRKALIKSMTDLYSLPTKARLPLLQGTIPKVRQVAIFSHGYDNKAALGSDIKVKHLPKLFTKLAPYLQKDVRVPLFSCSLAKDGTNSIAAKMRDSLADAGLQDAQVWGHTGVGHTTRYPLMKVYYAYEKGKPGHDYFRSVFSNAFLQQQLVEMGLNHADPAIQARRMAALRKHILYRFYIPAAKPRIKVKKRGRLVKKANPAYYKTLTKKHQKSFDQLVAKIAKTFHLSTLEWKLFDPYSISDDFAEIATNDGKGVKKSLQILWYLERSKHESSIRKKLEKIK